MFYLGSNIGKEERTVSPYAEANAPQPSSRCISAKLNSLHAGIYFQVLERIAGLPISRLSEVCLPRNMSVLTPYAASELLNPHTLRRTGAFIVANTSRKSVSDATTHSPKNPPPGNTAMWRGMPRLISPSSAPPSELNLWLIEGQRTRLCCTSDSSQALGLFLA